MKNKEPLIAESSLLAELEQAIKINPDNLDREVLQQPELYYRAGKVLMELTSRRDAAKQAYAEAEAIADREIREDAAKAKERITETEIQSLKIVHPLVKQARDRYFELLASVGQFSEVKEAIKMRSYALTEFIKLYLADYQANTSYRDNRERLREGEVENAKRKITEGYAKRGR